MLLKVPSVDWTDQIIYVVDDDESLSDFDDEPDFSEYMWMENEEEFDKNVSKLNTLFLQVNSFNEENPIVNRNCNAWKRRRSCRSVLRP